MGGLAPLLPLCGQLTRCFSAVGEVLVEFGLEPRKMRLKQQLFRFKVNWNLVRSGFRDRHQCKIVNILKNVKL